MNRREFLLTSAAGAGLITASCARFGEREAVSNSSVGLGRLKLLPYPQQLRLTGGSLPLGLPRLVPNQRQPTATEQLALDSLRRSLPRGAPSIGVRLGSIEEGHDPNWLAAGERQFLLSEKTSSEASVLRINLQGITVVGKGKYGMLYGVQTACQLAREATAQQQNHIPCLTVRDWPDLRWRCLSPTLTWYSGWNRLEGYDLCNWTEAEWKWLADWSMLHKCNGWAVCMYGYWPFTLPGYPQETLEVDSFHYNPETGKKEAWRFTHRNIQSEFYSRVIRYANQRGIKVYAYIGKNSFNGCQFQHDAKIYAGGAAELLPFAPGIAEYWESIVSRILELGFNGFVFEDPEAYHVPTQNAECYKAFWEPWAEKYGFKSVADTDRNKPPVGVHIEYYTWLYRRFAGSIRQHSQRLGRSAEIYLISHILLARVMAESATNEERRRWMRLIDEKHGEKVPFIIAESNEAQYVELLGAERVASLGGRGGSCTNAMRRIASVNNNWLPGGMGGDLAYERDCQRRLTDYTPARSPASIPPHMTRSSSNGMGMIPARTSSSRRSVCAGCGCPRVVPRRCARPRARIGWRNGLLRKARRWPPCSRSSIGPSSAPGRTSSFIRLTMTMTTTGRTASAPE